MSAMPTPALDSILVVLRPSDAASRTDDVATPVAAIEVPLPNGTVASMLPAWYDLVGDLQARLVRIDPTAMSSVHAEEVAALGADEALALALANLERLHGAPTTSPWHNLQRVGGRSADHDSSYFLDHAFWRSQLETHPDGLVVAVPRIDALLFTPASDSAAVDSLRRGVAGLHAGGGDYQLSSALYLFKDDRWTVFQPAAPAP
jgi:hypothetical protein